MVLSRLIASRKSAIVNAEMSTHRFYLPTADVHTDDLHLEAAEAHHALHVLRLKRGDQVVVLDGAGMEFRCQVADHSRDTVSLRIVQKHSVPPLPCSVTLLVGVPKGKIVESIIQKSVELGVNRVVPLLTARVVSQLDDDDAEHKRQKWQQVAVEAIKQCGAAWLPKIEPPATIDRFLARRETFDLALVGSLREERRHPKEIFQEYRKSKGHFPRTVALWIGPEGDFTTDELKAIQDAGARPITLGELTLRVETAAIYCLSIVRYEVDIDNR